MIRKTSAAVCDDRRGWCIKTSIRCFVRRGEEERCPIRVHDAWWNRYRKQSVRSILLPILIVSYNVTYTTYKTTIFIKKPGNKRGTLSSFLLCPLPLLKTLYDVFKCVLRHFSFLVIFPCHSCSRSQLELIKDRFPQRISLETSSRMTEKTHFSYRVDFIIYGLFKALFDAFKCVLRRVSWRSDTPVPPFLLHLKESAAVSGIRTCQSYFSSRQVMWDVTIFMRIFLKNS